MLSLTTLTLLLTLPLLVLSKTDLQGCVSTDLVVYGGASLLFYMPDTGEICSFLDCGGGRAPPKTTKPGCGGYKGTETVTPDFVQTYSIPGYSGPKLNIFPASTTAADSVTVVESVSPSATPTVTAGPTITGVVVESSAMSSSGAGEADTATAGVGNASSDARTGAASSGSTATVGEKASVTSKAAVVTNSNAAAGPAQAGWVVGAVAAVVAMAV
jgi:hypothetical protein